MSWKNVLKSLPDFSKFIEEEFTYSNMVFDEKNYAPYIKFDDVRRRKVKEAKQKVLNYFDNLTEEEQEEIALAINFGDGSGGSVDESILYSIMIGLMAKAMKLNIEEVVEGYTFQMLYEFNARAVVEEANV
tara:strand:- start:781 stop:1173 length:393 start_codon:yes stop_codon:yes gene_type:complete